MLLGSGRLAASQVLLLQLGRQCYSNSFLHQQDDIKRWEVGQNDLLLPSKV